MSAVSLMQSDEFRSRVQEWVRSIEERTNYHSLDLGNGTIIEGVISVDALRSRLHDLEVPESLEGRRVLDVGAASGWNSFELERRGAEVVAIDCVAYEEFRYASSLLNSTVDYRMVDVDEISPELLGTFDIVLFLGVLYHLRHPLLALEKLCAVTREVAFVESFVTDSLMSPSGQTSMEFYEIDELGGQIDNWFGPTTACLVALCRSAGFATVQLQYSQGGRAGLICRRKWEAAPSAPEETAPHLISAVNNRTNQSTFHRGLDEYICLYFRFDNPLRRQDLLIEVSGYGIAPLTVTSHSPGEWQANSKLPPGLTIGEHSVRIRTVRSMFSGSYTVQMLESASSADPLVFRSASVLSAEPVELFRVVNSKDETSVFQGHRAERLSAFFTTAEKHLKQHTVLTECAGTPIDIELVIELGGGTWQINAKLPRSLRAGFHTVRVRTANSDYSEARIIQIQEPMT